MTSPVAASVATSVTSSDSTNHVMTMPSGVNSGDLLVAFHMLQTNTVDITAPSGWTNIVDGSSNVWGFYKVSDGTEGASQTFTTASSTTSGHIVYRITGYAGTPEFTFNSSTDDPPSITPSWGSFDNLYIPAIVEFDTTPQDITAAPTNYSSLQKTAEFTFFGIFTTRVGSAQRALTASTEDPGTFTQSYTSGGTSLTSVIKGVAAATGRSYGFIF